MNLVKTSLGLILTLSLAACSTTSNNVASTSKAVSDSGKTKISETLGKHENVVYSDGIKTMVTEEGDVQIEDNENIVCTRTRKTGSRVGSTRVCMTKLEYDEQRREQKEMARFRDNVNPGIGSDN